MVRVSQKNYFQQPKIIKIIKIIYFDEGGRVIDHPEEEIPFGFIMGGFPEGLSSLIAESREDQTILATDLIYSDHTSVSVIQMDILPLE
mgnify:CR=1 FL=1